MGLASDFMVIFFRPKLLRREQWSQFMDECLILLLNVKIVREVQGAKVHIMCETEVMHLELEEVEELLAESFEK